MAEFICLSTAAEWLRRRYHIVGRASLSTDQTARIAGTSSVPTRLPIRLSVEEVTLLLHEGIVHGLRRTWPISTNVAPTDEQRELFHTSLRKNTEEMQEILSVKRRISATGFYSQLLSGLAVHRKRQFSRNSHPADADVTPSVCSVRQRRKELREQKRQKLTECNEHLSPSSEMRDQEDKRKCSDQLSNIELKITEQPTLDNLLQQYAVDRSEPLYDPDKACPPEKNWRSCVPHHLPRATPQQWERADEVHLIPLPKDVKSHGLIEVLRWLVSLMKMDKSQSASRVVTEFPMHNLDVRQSIRCLVFADLWSRGAFVTTSSVKMGGDFLVYPGDPLIYHASHVVLTTLPEEPLAPRQLAARMRLTNSVRKSLVLATVPLIMLTPHIQEKEPKALPSQVFYTTIQWTNWIHHF
ncbi:tRNA-splicing endonuclease subunit Sen34 [Fasciola gigantica]|uniref:tRNA-intron lyase n=1 Tax=Fasciola gigantica TaxID=46835 RepID=A0A504YDV2_FASGI|nr:tRNA-splicing endonuclease subunit Sen34 [Fasciola gigantica]